MAEAAAHSSHADHGSGYLRRFWIVLALTVPTLYLSVLPAALFGYTPPSFAGSGYVRLALGTIVFLYGGWPFLAGAWREWWEARPGMMTLIALATSAAYVSSAIAVLAGAGETLFWELATLVCIMLFGHYLEARAVAGARGAMHELAELLPDSAEVVRNGTPLTLALKDLRPGDLVRVRPGGKVPADGVVADGQSEVSEALVTGESRPVGKSVGSPVIAGSINGDGALTVRLEKVGADTFLAGIMRMVADAEASKSRLELLSDTAARYLTLIALSAGAATFFAWTSAGATTVFALQRLVAVLVIACPHALGLAIPLVASISTSMAAKSGYFVKRRLELEAARTVTTVLFDKTGTLTTGEFGVVAVVGPEEETLALAAAVNGGSEHPLSKAIVSHAQQKGVAIPHVGGFMRIPGKGVAGIVDNFRVLVGSERLLEDEHVIVPDEALAPITQHELEGRTVNHVIKNGAYVGSLALVDVVRPESKAAVAELRSMGVKVAMITGDSEDVASAVARQVGITEYYAHVLPQDKSETVKQLQKSGEKVAMVGDGVNDAPALTQADVGIAIGAGTNVAIESAGIILVKSDPRDIPELIRLSKATYAKMRQNLFWATGYNVVALPAAAGAFAGYGITLGPAAAAVLMSLSTVIVAVNAIALRRVRVVAGNP